ncbi:MAG: ImmA/IrrE family metallo-endopeptidase [Thermodesulfobacteriota bacterium]
MTDQEISARARRFWDLAGVTEPFPRSLERAVAWALPLAVVKLPRLGLLELRSWLERRNLRFPLSVPNRRLRACLIARAGHGFIFLDGSDSDNERRFSLAHELAHFLLDYLDPREQALELLGEAGHEVLDGRRSPTAEERLRGVLHGVKLTTYLHLMDRTAKGAVPQIQILETEDRADRLALELLAPKEAVTARLAGKGVDWYTPTAITLVKETLSQEFGLPEAVAEPYGQMLIIQRQHLASFRQWLGVEG